MNKVYFGKNTASGEWVCIGGDIPPSMTFSGHIKDSLRPVRKLPLDEWESIFDKAELTDGIIAGDKNGYPVVIPKDTPEYKKQIEIETLKGYLASTDYVALKIAEGSATREEYADVIAQREEWRSRIRELEGL